MKNLITTFLFFVSILSISAQDFQFTQFQFAPLNLNPAMTGVECGDQLTVNYRNQWKGLFTSDAFQTMAVSYDRFFKLKNGDKVGAGLNLSSDWNAGSVSQRNAGLAFSYQKRLSKSETSEQFIVAGLSGGWAQKTVDFLNLTWGSQTDGMGGFDPDKPSFENFNRDQVNFADLAVGFSYLANFNKIKNLRFGIASFHVNRANVSFDSNVEDEIYRRYTIHGQAEFLMGEKWSLLPRFVYTGQGPSDSVIAGSGIKYRFGKAENQSLELGAGVRGANYLEEGIRMNGVLFAATYFYKNFGISVLGEKNRNFLPSGDRIDSYEAAVIYRFCK